MLHLPLENTAESGNWWLGPMLPLPNLNSRIVVSFPTNLVPNSILQWVYQTGGTQIIPGNSNKEICGMFCFILTSSYGSTGSHRSKKLEWIFFNAYLTKQSIGSTTKAYCDFYQINKEVKVQTEEVILSTLNHKHWERLIYLLC